MPTPAPPDTWLPPAPLDRTDAGLAHRPWPLPTRRPFMRMRWRDLAFLHWPVDPETLRPTIPNGLELETFDGKAWLGIVPFRMEDVAPIGLPAAGKQSNFPEINLRTYVTAEGMPGVWFYSLDVPRPLAVWVARRGFHLPYFRADMEVARTDEVVCYASARRGVAPLGAFRGSYGPAASSSARLDVRPGSLEHWLTERYCLYAADRRGRVFRGHVHHAPWPLQEAECVIDVNTLAGHLPVDLPAGEVLAHVSSGVDVVAWWPERVGARSAQRT